MLDALQVKFATFPATALVTVTRVPLTITLSETAVTLVRATVGVGTAVAEHSRYPVAPVRMAHSEPWHRRLLVLVTKSGGTAWAVKEDLYMQSCDCRLHTIMQYVLHHMQSKYDPEPPK